MGRNSEYNKEKIKQYRLKYAELIKKLPVYTYDYLNEKAYRNPNTGIAYAGDLLIFFEYLKANAPSVKDLDIREIPMEFLEDLTFQDINEYMDYLDESHPEFGGRSNSRSGIARRMSALRGFYKYQCTHDQMKRDPTSGARPVKIEEHAIVRMNKQEVETLIQTVERGSVGSEHQKKIIQNTVLRDTAIMVLLLNTGIRVSECAGLDISDINFNERSLLVVRKGRKEAFLYFNDAVYDALKDYIEIERPGFVSDDDAALFLSTRKTRMAIRSIQELVKKYTRAAVSNKSLSAHKMRSTYGTQLYNETGDIRLVADVLGHKDINTTAKHYAATEDQRRRLAGSINLYDKM